MKNPQKVTAALVFQIYIFLYKMLPREARPKNYVFSQKTMPREARPEKLHMIYLKDALWRRMPRKRGQKNTYAHRRYAPSKPKCVRGIPAKLDDGPIMVEMVELSRKSITKREKKVRQLSLVHKYKRALKKVHANLPARKRRRLRRKVTPRYQSSLPFSSLPKR